MSYFWPDDVDFGPDIMRLRAERFKWPMFLNLAYRCIGIIYGDLGTSPLYTYPSVFTDQPSELAILGSCSLIIYILILEVVIKYVIITLYADDNDEGGTFAVYSLLCRYIGISPFGNENLYEDKYTIMSKNVDKLSTSPSVSEKLENKKTNKRKFGSSYPYSRSEFGAKCSRNLIKFIHRNQFIQHTLLVFVMWGIAMFLSDGMLTCSVEVVSAISGLRVKIPSISTGTIVGISCAILACLFSIQFLGTNRIGFIFSPILITWFLINSIIGIYNVIHFYPAIFKVFNPAYGFRYLVNEGKAAWISLGGVVLCVTGCESLFSDLGHFSRQSIQFSTMVLVFPACLVTYLGEAAYMMKHPENFSNPYFYALPSWSFWPILVVATAASIVSAQSLISASFSIVSQGISSGCFPSLKVERTSEKIVGQVYVPFVNWALFIGSIIVTCAFQTTQKIGNAFGLAFVSVMIITTIMTSLVQVVVWKWNPIITIFLMGFIFVIEAVCFSALCYKVPGGAWFPLASGIVILLITYIWHYGTNLRMNSSRKRRLTLNSVLETTIDKNSSLKLISDGSDIHRIDGVAIYYTENIGFVPHAFPKLLQKTLVLHKTVIFLTVQQVPLPTIKANKRLLLSPAGLPGFFVCVARYGYQDIVDHGPEFIEYLFSKLEDCNEHFSPQSSEDDFSSEIKPVRAGPSVPVVSTVRENLLSSNPTYGPCCDLKVYKDNKNSMSALPNFKVVYVLSKPVVYVAPEGNIIKKIALGTIYSILLDLCYSPTSSWHMPREDVIEVAHSNH